jgi:hypothetical protein
MRKTSISSAAHTVGGKPRNARDISRVAKLLHLIPDMSTTRAGLFSMRGFALILSAMVPETLESQGSTPRAGRDTRFGFAF